MEQFARWHHLRRLRKASVPGQSSAAGARYAKQEITEAIKFLTWLHSTHHRTLASCRQQDVDEWLASGPTTRLKIRNLLAWAKKTRVNKSVQITHQQPPPSRALTQQQRLAWLRELLDGDSESLAYRVAGILLLLFGQPLTKIAALPTSAITITENDMRISLGQEPIPVRNRSQTCWATTWPAGRISEQRPEWRPHHGCSRSSRPGRHLGPNFIMTRLRNLGINLLAARNTALQSLVVEAPPPLVAELLGYSYNTTQRHAEIAAQPWARYVTKTAAESN